MAIQHSNSSSSLADILERVLDKGIVVAGDIKISLADVDLLNIKIRLLVASVDKAKEMGIDWWQHDPYLSSRAQVSPAIPAPRGAEINGVPNDILKPKSVDSTSFVTEKEEIESDANSAMYDLIGVNKKSWEGSNLDNSSGEKLNSEFGEGRFSSLGKPSVGRSIERVPKG